MSSKPTPNPAESSKSPEASTSAAAAAASNTSLGVTLKDDEEAQLADFERYMQADSDTVPTVSTVPSITPSTTMQAQLDELTKAYPNYDRGALTAVLEACNGDISASRRMLDDALDSNTRTQQTFTQEAEQAEHASQTPAENTESDSMLAAHLQSQENLRASRRSQGTQPSRRREAIQLTPAVMQRVVSSLREIVVPALRAHFEELVLPDTRDESSGFVYELQRVQIAALSLPNDNVAVRPAVDGTGVLVNVVGANLELEVGRWSYEGRGLMPVQDSGRARASVHGLNVALRLKPVWRHGETRLNIAECEVTVDGIVRFKTQGAAADWAYNAIAVLFKPWVVSYVKEAVSDAVVRVLAVHLRQLELAAGGSWLEEQAPRQDASTRSSGQTSAGGTQAPVSASE